MCLKTRSGSVSAGRASRVLILQRVIGVVAAKIRAVVRGGAGHARVASARDRRVVGANGDRTAADQSRRAVGAFQVVKAVVLRDRVVGGASIAFTNVI